MQFNKNFLLSVTGKAVLIVMLCSFLAAGCNRRDTSGQTSVESRPAPEVAVITVSARRLVLTTELPGRTAASRVARIRPRVNGLVRKRLFTEGSLVKAGQVLYQIDPVSFQADFEAAQATLAAAQKTAARAEAALTVSMSGIIRQQAVLELAQLNSSRFEALAKVNAVSASDVDKFATELKVARASLGSARAQAASDREAVEVAKAGILQARAALKAARINLGYCRVTSPIRGRIGKSNVTEGAVVTAYQQLPLATVQQLDPIYVDVPQSTAELMRLSRRMGDGRLSADVKNQDKVKLFLGDDAAYPWEGVLQFQDVTVDPSTGSVVLRAVFPNPDILLLPGMFVRAVVKEGVMDQAILIPQQGVSRDSKGHPLALVVNNAGKVEQRMLTLDRAVGNQWLVLSGLAPGDRVIVEGMQKVRPGAAVRVVPFGGEKPEQVSTAAPGDPSDASTNGGD